jgi:uncharacterized integral membrane protein
MINSMKSLFITCLLILGCGFITGAPWWLFVVPVFMWGAGIRFLQWRQPVFLLGFIAGCLVWAGANMYFNSRYNNVLNKIGLLLSVPTTLVFIGAAIIGGLLSALALYTGHMLLHTPGSSSVKTIKNTSI